MTKVPLTITVDEDLLNEFKRVCEEMDIKMSTKINTLIKEWLSENKKE